MQNLNGRPVVVITNANNDFGEATAIRFSEDKYNLTLGFVSDDKKVNTIGGFCRRSGSEVSFAKLNDLSVSSFSQVFESTINSYGRIDSVVNTITVSRSSYSVTMKKSTWDSVLETNLDGTINCINSILPIFVNQKCGNIILVLSLDALSGVSGHSHQSTSESIILEFMKSIVRQVGQYNIRVNAVIHGFIMTEYAFRAPARIKSLHLQDIPLGYYGTPGDVAETVAYLASDRASYITGQAIIVDGGLSGGSYLCWQMLSAESELR